jgi:3-deoxy-D-manno-octulosonic-acid transferase
MGPHTFNFLQAAEWAEAAGAAERVADLQVGVLRAVAVTTDPARVVWAERALVFASQHRGAAARMAQAVLAAARPA